MKLYSIVVPVILTATAGFVVLSEEPFQYKYEIVANSTSPKDIVDLYNYKEKVINIYEKKFMGLSSKELEVKLIKDISLFTIAPDARPSYAYGTIVILVGKAEGMHLQGNLKTNTCDETIIRTKILLFDLFS